MSLQVFTSPRSRRRTIWLGGALAVAVTFLVLSVALPRGAPPSTAALPGRPQLVPVLHAVPLTVARRQAIDSILDTFVPAVVERHDPLRAHSLVTPAFRAGVTHADWLRGRLPVLPYDAEGNHFHGWTLDYSLADEISVDLLLRPGARETRGAIAFTAVFKRRHGRWLVDEFIPVASFARDNARTKKIVAQPDFTPAAKGP
jgi:hypothetical protein